MKLRLFILLTAAVAALLSLTALSPENPTSKKEIHGIDISHYNGDINWKKVPKTIQFVYIKATEGYTLKDSKFADNLKDARAQGFKVGAYHYFHMSSSAHAQFENFTATVKKSDLDLIPMIDVETLDGRSPKQLRDSLRVFANLLEDYYGKTPMIYAPLSHYNSWLSPHFNNYHLYIGRYGKGGYEGFLEPEIEGKGHYSIWQYNERGSVAGIPGRVDLARFHSECGIKSITL